MGVKYKFCVAVREDENDPFPALYHTEYEFKQLDYGKLYAQWQVDSIITKDKGSAVDVDVSDFREEKCGQSPFYEIQDRTTWELSSDMIQKLFSGNPEQMLSAIGDGGKILDEVYAQLKEKVLEEVEEEAKKAEKHYSREATKIKAKYDKELTKEKAKLDKSLTKIKSDLDKELTEHKKKLDKTLDHYKHELDNELTKLWGVVTSPFKGIRI